MDPRIQLVSLVETASSYVIENARALMLWINCYLVVPKFEICIAKQVRTQAKIAQIDKAVLDCPY